MLCFVTGIYLEGYFSHEIPKRTYGIRKYTRNFDRGGLCRTNIFGDKMRQETIKLNAGQVRVPATLIYDDDEERITVRFGYNKLLIAEIRNMEDRRYHGIGKHATTPPRKEWSIANTPRNMFQLAYLQGLNPYAHWDKDLVTHDYERPLREHQCTAADFMLTRRQCVLAHEMGCVSGDAIVHINRARKSSEISLKRLHYSFNGGVSHNKIWDESIPTFIRSLKDDVLGLHRIIKTLHKGIKETILVTLKSGKSIQLTPDHEVYVGYNKTKPAGSLVPGDTVLSNGQRVRNDGYVSVYVSKDSGHPRGHHGYVLQHVLVAEEQLGRYLTPEECVHHINGIKHDNSPENLKVMLDSDHKSLHAKREGFKNMHGGTAGTGGKIHFVPHFDTVVSVVPCGKCDVYDVVCDDPYHSFVADEIVISNSGKTLAAIEVIERSNFTNWFWIAPKSALMSVHIEFKKWNMKFRPRTMTYEGLTKLIREWNPGQRAPQGIIFDESARVKNPTSQRSQAAKHLANSMRREYGLDAYVILMSGAPAPKSPVDWYHQCEIACPGFLKEGNVATFKQRLAIIVDRESVQGGMYPHIVSWLDDSKKCAECGEFREVGEHIPSVSEEYHEFVPSVNEVAFLGERMSGLVHVKFKKDCLSLPDKQYRQIVVEPTQKIINAAQGIVSRARNVASAITKLRTLSDGFIYREKVTGEVVCPVCKGIFDNRPIINNQRYCDRCDNVGKIENTIREAQQIDCPKEQVVIDLLDEYFDIGRVVFYAGFTGSITRVVDICKKCGWDTLKADGHGWKASFDGDMLDVFQNGQNEQPRIAFIGQPGAAGTGLTLTASPVIIYYSNDFDADHRIQSEDRCHRMGMDENRGCTIIDIFHLPTDELVYNNLKLKRAMQSLTLNELNEVLDGN